MKRRFLKFVSLLLLVVPFSLGGCKNKNETSVTITVVHGTGSGTYAAGDEVTIIATVPTNKLFDYWSVDNKKVSEDCTYIFTANKTATYTACFKDDPNPPDPNEVTCKILVVSDVHVSADDVTSKNHLKNTLNYASSSGVDAIIFDGDTPNLARDTDYNALDSVFTEVYKAPKASGLPRLIFNMGNHEFYPTSNCAHEETDYEREFSKFKGFAEKWGEAIKDNVFMREIKGVRVVAAFPSADRTTNQGGKTVYFAANGAYSQNDINKVKSQFDDILNSGYEKSIIFCTHHPLGQTYGSTLYGMESTSEYAFKDMLKDYPMTVHLHGHTHFSSLHERSISQNTFTSIQIGMHTYGKYVSDIDYDEDGDFLKYENITSKRINDYDAQAKGHHGETNFGMLLSFTGLNMLADRIYLQSGEKYSHTSWTVPHGITKENKNSKFLYKNGDRTGEQLTFSGGSEINTTISSNKLVSLSFEDVEQYWACEGYIIEVKNDSDEVIRKVLWASLFWVGLKQKQTYTIPLSQIGDPIVVGSGYSVTLRGINFFGHFSNELTKTLA